MTTRLRKWWTSRTSAPMFGLLVFGALVANDTCERKMHSPNQNIVRRSVPIKSGDVYYLTGTPKLNITATDGDGKPFIEVTSDGMVFVHVGASCGGYPEGCKTITGVAIVRDREGK